MAMATMITTGLRARSHTTTTIKRGHAEAAISSSSEAAGAAMGVISEGVAADSTKAASSDVVASSQEATSSSAVASAAEVVSAAPTEASVEDSIAVEAVGISSTPWVMATSACDRTARGR